MPDTDWRAWVHVTASTLGHWLPGDERGFRSRRHRLHSSGDYQNPPPPAEHAGLRRDAEARSNGVVRLDPAQRQIVVAALQTKLEEMGTQPRAIACDALHCHALVCCAGDAKVVFGRAKQAASHALREQIPGKVWDDRHTPRGSAMNGTTSASWRTSRPMRNRARRYGFRLDRTLPEGWGSWGPSNPKLRRASASASVGRSGPLAGR